MATKRDLNQQPLKERVLQFIRENRLLSSGEKLVVAVSGGPDSVCLLHILASLKSELGIELHAAHLNHQLREAESEADAKYVSTLAKKLGIPVTIEKEDVKGYQAKNIPASCKGCGLCAASCPQLTIDMLHFRDLQIEASICAAV